ncbi:nucleoporin Nup37 [Anastrepha ludens]|uniref:nucleoporin Nup37 n=1 Tax=Anastrepha ludens TaxID=28586 RepID=UPI0023B0575F|nr:nucleoporin Nup37 [Anastrepha ludens]
MRNFTAATHTWSFPEQIEGFEFCDSDFACNLLALGSSKKIILGLISLPEESGCFDWKRLKDLYHESRCVSLCFAPETSLVVVPKSVIFCAAGADFRLRIFRTDLQNSDTVQILNGHTNYINQVIWDCNGEFLASVGDDSTCRIWDTKTNFENSVTFHLLSAGMSVKCHPEEPHKVLVAEKRGVIHLYNIQTQAPLISVEAQKCPLRSVDWCPLNRMCITALVAGDIVTWDLRRPLPIDIKQVHEDGGQIVRIAPNAETVVASVGRPDVSVKVFTAKSRIPLVDATLKLYGGMSWHHRLPYIGVASDRKLYLWKLQIK